jgi:hypothetical protein
MSICSRRAQQTLSQLLTAICMTVRLAALATTATPAARRSHATATRTTRHSARSLLLLVLVVCSLGASGLITSQASAASLPPSTLGVYVGGGNTAEVTSFASWLGERPAYALDYLPGESWSTIEQPSWILGQWGSIGESSVLSVPMLPASGATLAQGATGAYNSYFTTLARSLVANGDSNAILRLGWEMNGNWFPWSIENGNAANYAAYWRQIVTTMRSISPGFRFDFTVNDGSSSVSGQLLNPEAAYPGDEYVNYIGMDVYDTSWSAASNAEARWASSVNQSYGLAWQREFAAAHGKPVTFPEWGLDTGGGGYGGGDSPAFIQLMYSWMASSNMAYEVYFNFDTSNEKHALTDYPNAAALYKQLFGPSGGSELTAPSPTPEPAPTPTATPKPAPTPAPTPPVKPPTTRKKARVRSSTGTVRASIAEVGRPKLRVQRIHARSGATLAKLSWVAGGTRVVVLRNGRKLQASGQRGSLVVALGARPRTYSVCEVGTHICSVPRRVA